MELPPRRQIRPNQRLELHPDVGKEVKEERVATDEVSLGFTLEDVDIESLQPPNHPGCAHVEVGMEDGELAVGAGIAVREKIVELVVVVRSLHPNHPG